MRNMVALTFQFIFHWWANMAPSCNTRVCSAVVLQNPDPTHRMKMTEGHPPVEYLAVVRLDFCVFGMVHSALLIAG